MKTKIIAAFLVLTSSCSYSQNVPPDVTGLWSQTGISGTARSMGSGGAYGSVGADMGCIDINPAGLGLYRSTDFSITPLLQFGANQAQYDNNNTFAHKTSFALAQGGFVYTKLFKKPTDNANVTGFSDHPVRSFSLALNFQQQAIFDRSQQYGTNSAAQSLIDGYVSNLNSGNLSVYSAPEVFVASVANLFDVNPNGSYYSRVKGPSQQVGDIETRGSINRIDAAFGLNFLDKLYFGVDVAVPILGYGMSNSLYESPANSSTTGIQDYTLNTDLSESGVGFNGIIGLIYRPLPFMRVGAAYHLPTWYTIHEDYQFGLTVDSPGVQTGWGPQSLPTFQYGIRTPMKGDFSASFYYKEYGFISIDYDIQNLGATRMHVPNDSLQVEPYYNQQIAGTYKLTHTIHAGLEAAIKIVRLRAGYNYATSPFKNGQQYIPTSGGFNGVKNAFTLGLGVRLQHFYADLAYIYGWSKDASYQLTNTLPVNSINTASTLVLTLGWRFDAGAKSNNNQQKTQQRKYTPPPPVDDQRY